MHLLNGSAFELLVRVEIRLNAVNWCETIPSDVIVSALNNAASNTLLSVQTQYLAGVVMIGG